MFKCLDSGNLHVNRMEIYGDHKNKILSNTHQYKISQKPQLGRPTSKAFLFIFYSVIRKIYTFSIEWQNIRNSNTSYNFEELKKRTLTEFFQEQLRENIIVNL